MGIQAESITETAVTDDKPSFVTYDQPLAKPSKEILYQSEESFFRALMDGDIVSLDRAFNDILGIETPVLPMDPNNPDTFVNYSPLVDRDAYGIEPSMDSIRQAVIPAFVDRWLSFMSSQDPSSKEFAVMAVLGGEYMSKRIVPAMQIDSDVNYDYTNINRLFQGTAADIFQVMQLVRERFDSKIPNMKRSQISSQDFENEASAIYGLSHSIISMLSLLSSAKYNKMGSQYKHDLATPLNPIYGYSQFIQEVTDFDEFVEDWEKISTNIDLGILKLCDLDKYLAQENGVVLRVTPIGQLQEIVEGVAAKFERYFGEIELITVIDWAEMPSISLDSDALQLMLDELLGNIYKYGRNGKFGPRGKVDLVLRVRQGSAALNDRTRYLDLHILDYGKGFQMDIEKAKEVGNSTGGTGLGLPFVIEKAEEMGMEVDIVNRPENRWHLNVRGRDLVIDGPTVGSMITLSTPIIPGTGHEAHRDLRI
jgi:signal transduction histidine kinase